MFIAYNYIDTCFEMFNNMRNHDQLKNTNFFFLIFIIILHSIKNWMLFLNYFCIQNIFSGYMYKTPNLYFINKNSNNKNNDNNFCCFYIILISIACSNGNGYNRAEFLVDISRCRHDTVHCLILNLFFILCQHLLSSIRSGVISDLLPSLVDTLDSLSLTNILGKSSR